MKQIAATKAMASKVVERQQQKLGAFVLFALAFNCVLLQALSEAQLASSTKYIYPNQEFGIEQLEKLIGANQAELASADSQEISNNILDSSSNGNLVDLASFLSGNERVASSQIQQRLLANPIMASKLADYLGQQQQQQGNDEQESNDIGATMGGDINTHLPARGFDAQSVPSESLISGPVNDPADFEAALSTLTNTINHELPNSSTRNEMLSSLMSGYLGDLVKGSRRLQGDGNGSRSSGAGSSSSSSQTSTTPASRYGGGEYIDHPLALVGHQYVQGGAGEGKQLLGPDGTFENVQVVKTDHAVPSYCDPPNPCPIGYTAEDGCIEKFVNSASFSREYQARQQCSCDNEHSLFNCAAPIATLKGQSAYSSSSPPPSSSASSSDDETATTEGDGDGESSQSPSLNSILGIRANSVDDSTASESLETLERAAVESKLDTLARTIQNRFGSLASIRNLIGQQKDDE